MELPIPRIPGWLVAFAVIVACIAIASVIGGGAYWLVKPRMEANAAAHSAKAEVNSHAHQWGKWSEPVTTSNWYVGTFFTQSRRCDTCGAVEMREIQVSTHANK